MAYFIEIISILTLAFLAVLAFKFYFAKVHSVQKKVSLAFFVCIASYLSINLSDTINQQIFFILLVPTLALPYIFWMYCRIIFSDSFELNTKIYFGLAGFIAVQSLLFLAVYSADNLSLDNSSFWKLLPRFNSMLFVILGIWEVARNKSVDVINSRLQYREVIIFFTAFIIIATLLSELTFSTQTTPIWLIIAQKLGIFGLITYALLRHFKFSKEFYLESKSKPEQSNFLKTDHSLMENLKELMMHKKWKTEGLTIHQLASDMNVKEYKLRQAINYQLDFRNFNDFVNSYRIAEAKTILSDPDKKDVNIQEIAYDLGYNSISPFNKAFKAATGVTPTEWRKAAISNLK